MINRLVIGDSHNPWSNLALEKYLYRTCTDENILYLWQNADTVVIGRNQNAWKECDLKQMDADGVKLARRESGGGAVFHDLGNLNFTFISPNAVHDVHRQMGVIQAAVGQFGVETDLSGRNDLTIRASGSKFSGNAFQKGATCALHHGTILIDVDMEKIKRYLTPSAKKLEAKGIQSVRARVANLKAVEPSVSVDGMRAALVRAFEETYGPIDRTTPLQLDEAQIGEFERVLASWEWRLGNTPEFDITLNNRFAWGEVDLLLNVQRGHVTQAQVYSDALDEGLILRIAPLLAGSPFNSAALGERLRALGGIEGEDLAGWIAQESL